MLSKPPYVKYYQDEAILKQHVADGLSSREIAKLYKVSYRLINLWLLQYGLIKHTSELALP
jgi:transposase